MIIGKLALFRIMVVLRVFLISMLPRPGREVSVSKGHTQKALS